MKRFVLALLVGSSTLFSLEATNWFKSKETRTTELKREVETKTKDAEKEVKEAEKAVDNVKTAEKKLADIQK